MDRLISQDLMEVCRRTLLTMKQDLLNRVRSHQNEFSQQEKSRGDEMDQSAAQIAEDYFLINQERMRRQLTEIEWALARIQNGEFGLCEETQEPIERDRLLALPFTRLSIEGAEIREHLRRKIATP